MRLSQINVQLVIYCFNVRKIFHFMVGHYMHLIFDQLTIPEVIHTTKRQFRINNIEIDHSIHTDSDRVP